MTSGGIPAAKLHAAPTGDVDLPGGESPLHRLDSQQDGLAAIESASEDEDNLPDNGEEGN